MMTCYPQVGRAAAIDAVLPQACQAGVAAAATYPGTAQTQLLTYPAHNQCSCWPTLSTRQPMRATSPPPPALLTCFDSCAPEISPFPRRAGATASSVASFWFWQCGQPMLCQAAPVPHLQPTAWDSIRGRVPLTAVRLQPYLLLAHPACRPSAASSCGRSSCCGLRTCPAAGAPCCAASLLSAPLLGLHLSCRGALHLGVVHIASMVRWDRPLGCNVVPFRSCTNAHAPFPCSLVVLSGCDDLVPSELVMAQLKLAGHPAKVS